MPLGHFGDLHVMPPSVCFLLRMPSFLLLTWPLPPMDAKYSLGEGPPHKGARENRAISMCPRPRREQLLALEIWIQAAIVSIRASWNMERRT